jgi:flagellar basal body-associated protein FliL
MQENLTRKEHTIMSMPTYAEPQQQQQSRRSRRLIYILVGAVAALILIGFGTYAWVTVSSTLNNLKQNGSTPVSTT